MTNDENPTLRQYSNLEVYGRINQKTAPQGTDADSVLLYGSHFPVSGTGSAPPSTSGGTAQEYFKGQMYVLSTTVNSSTVKTIWVCTDVGGTSGAWTYTWEQMGSPFAPSTSGTTGQVLRANSNSAPTWENTGSVTSANTGLVTGGTVYTALTDGTVSKVGTATKGGTLKIMYLNAGVPTDGTQLYNDKVSLNNSASTYSNMALFKASS